MSAQDPCGVADRLTATELGQRGIHDHRMATQLGNGGFEGDPGPRRRLVEEHRLCAGASEGTQLVWLGLERVGEIQDRELLRGAEIVIDQEMPHQDSSVTWSSSDGSTRTKRSSSMAPMISGGARRSTSGRGALITKPAASAASTTAAARGSAKITACSKPRPRTPAINRWFSSRIAAAK